MRQLLVRGVCQGEFRTRADAIVACFERRLVYDQHSRKRNQLLPYVEIVGTDEEEFIPSTPIHPLDRK
jgi:hypothetical protein